MTAQGNSRWRLAPLPIVLLAILTPRLMPHDMPIPPWLPLTVAAALLVTAVLVGASTWRSAKADNA